MFILNFDFRISTTYVGTQLGTNIYHFKIIKLLSLHHYTNVITIMRMSYVHSCSYNAYTNVLVLVLLFDI